MSLVLLMLISTAAAKGGRGGGGRGGRGGSRSRRGGGVSGPTFIYVSNPSSKSEMRFLVIVTFVHDGIYKSVADYNSLRVGVVHWMSDVCPRYILLMGWIGPSPGSRASGDPALQVPKRFF